jgi:hypothetical protein
MEYEDGRLLCWSSALLRIAGASVKTARIPQQPLLTMSGKLINVRLQFK